MKKTGFALALAAMLVVPTGAAAAPTKAEKAASKECHELYEATKKNLELIGFKNFGHCVKEKTQEETLERKAARREARQACADLKGSERRDCVRSEKAEVKAQKDAKDAARVEAIDSCTTQSEEDPDTYTETYGDKERRALRRCVKAERTSGEEETTSGEEDAS